MAMRWRRGFGSYALLQLPGLLLAGAILAMAHRWAGLPVAWAVGLFLLYVAKEVVVAVALRDVLTAPPMGPAPAIGARGVAQDRLAPRGCVRIGAELWTAEAWAADRAIPAGSDVVVRGRRGLVLVV